jgi:hypothetical protein
MKAFLLLPILLALVSCVTTPKKSAWIPFEMKQEKMIISVGVKNTKTNAIFDTGAGITVIDSTLAKKLGIRVARYNLGSSLAATKLVGYADRVPFNFYGAEIRLNVAINDFSDQKVPITFGSDLLRAAVVEFDFPGQRMRFHNLGGYSYKGPTKPIKLIQKYSLYYVDLKINGEEKEFLVDTGAAGALFIPVSRKELDAAIQRGATKKILKGAYNESTEAYLGTAEPFELGSYTIEAAKISYYDKKDGFDLDGVLGMRIFKEFTLIIDTDNREMYLEAYENDFSDAKAIGGAK